MLAIVSLHRQGFLSSYLVSIANDVYGGEEHLLRRFPSIGRRVRDLLLAGRRTIAISSKGNIISAERHDLGSAFKARQNSQTEGHGWVPVDIT